jgi:hypothetical protein
MGLARSERLAARLRTKASSNDYYRKLAEEFGLDLERATIDDVLIERDIRESSRGSDSHSRIVWDRTDGSVGQQITVKGERLPVRILGPNDPLPDDVPDGGDDVDGMG